MAEREPHTTEKTDYEATLAAICFRAPEQARATFEHIAKLVPPSLLETLPPLLADSPNPDTALNLFDRFVSRDSYSIVRWLERNRQLIYYALVLFGNSQYLGETLIQNADILQALLRESSLGRVQSVEDFAESFARFSSRSFEADISVLLARFKRREYVRIVLRDLLRIATLAEVTAELSALADALIEEALRVCESNLQKRYGVPQHYDAENRLVPTRFSVLSLGKLGGNELNYSSDIDLLYIYADGRDAETTSIPAREFFIRLAQELTDVLGRLTPDGPVFRTDLRLRPSGAEGELAIPLNHALHYYGHVAQDWELQALIKLRHSAGDQQLARHFIRHVQPFVYRGPINFRAIETALESLHKIKSRSRRGIGRRAVNKPIDVKIDRGGIRDIEFLVQCLQRVYGGTEPWLRSGGTLFSMQKLHDKGHLSGADFHVLSASYTFLRQVEHRLQFWLGQQTHTLPRDEERLHAIGCSLAPPTAQNSPHDLVQLVRSHMQGVTAIYERIVHHQQTVERTVAAEPEIQQFIPPGQRSEAEVLVRVSVDSPALYELASTLPLGSTARRNYVRLLNSAASELERYEVLVNHVDLVRRALPVLAVSTLVTDSLVRRPEDIVEIAQVQEEAHSERGNGPSTHEGNGSAQTCPAPLMENLSSTGELPDRSAVMAELRERYRRRILRSCLRDFLYPRPVWSSVQETTHAAEAAIRTALQRVNAPAEFAVFALGRLGTGEFDVLSDADLLFVHAAEIPAERAAAAATDLVTLLSSYTNEGVVFTVDTRLRPFGRQGEMATTPAHLAHYFQSEGQAWEALSYTKLRYIAGSAVLAEQVFSAVRQLHQRFAADPGFRVQVREMRARLENSVAKEQNCKKGPGGFYDVDFIVSTLAIENSLPVGGGNIVERLTALGRAGLLHQGELALLSRAAEFFRVLEHSLRIVYGSARASLPASDAELPVLTTLIQASLARQLPAPLRETVSGVCTRVRSMFDLILQV